MQTSFLRKFILVLLLGLVSTFVIDPLDPTTLSTPFLLGMILMGLSLRQSLGLVAMSSLAYCVLVTIALVDFRSYYDLHIHAAPHPYFWLFQRLGLFFVVCAMANYMAYYRTETQRNLARFRTILGRLPAPVIISDGSGTITYANDAVTTVFHKPTSVFTGKSYFDFFLANAQKGKSIRSYFELFESDEDHIRELDVNPFGGPIKMIAQLTCLGVGANRIMITVLQNMEKKAEEAPSAEKAGLPSSVLRS